jgi:hypothetical protein
MRLEVDPDQRDPDDCELREPVGERRCLDQQPGALDGPLQRQLEHRAERALEVDDPLPVRERRSHAVAVGDAARQLVRDVEADPERELEHEVRPATRKATDGGGGGDGGHRADDSTRRSGRLPAAAQPPM